MAAAFQYAVLIIMIIIKIHKGASMVQTEVCMTEKPCFDFNLLMKMEGLVSKDETVADGEKILLNQGSFDKIRKKRNHHSCVLQRILDLFKDVLIDTVGKSIFYPKEKMNPHKELIHIMDQLKECLYKVKDNCNKLYKNAFLQTSNQSSASPSTISERDLSTKQLTVLQLQKLKNATEKVKDEELQNRVLDELKTLHSYLQGRGFRKIQRIKESHGVS